MSLCFFKNVVSKPKYSQFLLAQYIMHLIFCSLLYIYKYKRIIKWCDIYISYCEVLILLLNRIQKSIIKGWGNWIATLK